MEEQFVAFLDARGGGARHQQIKRGDAIGEAAVAAKETNAFSLFRLASSSARSTLRDLPLVVKAISRSPLLAEAPDLAREDFIGVVVVADGGHEFAVGGEGDGGIGPAVVAVAAEELGGQMGGVGSAAAIAAHQQFVAGGETPHDQLCGPVQRFLQGAQGASGLDRVVDSALQQCHAGRIGVDGGIGN